MKLENITDMEKFIEIQKISLKFGKYHEIGKYNEIEQEADGRDTRTNGGVIEIWKISLKF